MSQTIHYRPVGIIHSPFKTIQDMPIQPSGAVGITGTIEIEAAYSAGLADLDGFSHLILLYHFHQVEDFQLTVVPFLDTKPHGVFATRAPKRPNPIGLSVIRLVRVEGNTLHIENIDVLDGTPLLDIKPYVPIFDQQDEVRTGWLETAGDPVRHKRSDDRFR